MTASSLSAASGTTHPHRRIRKSYVIAPRHELFIDGKFVAPSTGKYFESINPATTEGKLTEIAPSGPRRMWTFAVKAARRAYDKVWSKMPGRERGKYLYRIARIIQEKSRELAVLETMDGGKTIKESRDVDLPLVAAHFFYHAGWADGKLVNTPSPAAILKSLGVAGQIIPWNFPLLMAAWKIAPALACGNTVVIKPAETTSITAMRLAQIFQEAGLPEGVVNIITGAGETGSAIVNHPDINKIAFTGSTEVGKRIAKTLAGTKKKLTLELGGKAANIIFEDAPIDQAIEGIIAGIYFKPGPCLLRRFAPCSFRKASSKLSSANCATASRRFASAIRSIKTPTSAPSIPSRNSTRSANSSKVAWMKARSSCNRAVRCRKKAIGSRLASSPASPPPIASRRRKFFMARS